MLSSDRARRTLVAVAGAVVLALAFPRTGIAWAAPVGAAALFWSWQNASWKRSLFLGWFAGWVFFTISFWWWTETIKDEVGPLAYAAVIIAAAIEALAIGVAALLAWYARTRCRPALAPLAAAAAFCIMEWMRSIGVLGVPFAQLGFTQADTPLRALAAYAGTEGVTLTICVLGAYAAYAIAARTMRPFAYAAGAVAAVTVVAWFAWPARHAPAPAIRVAAVQGNIAQSLKWTPSAVQLAIDRYTQLTQRAAASHPAIVLWPETVIPLGSSLLAQPSLVASFTQLARAANGTLVAGSLDVRNAQFFNSLFVFTPAGMIAQYDKRQLVPFAEHFPGQAFLGWLPYIGQLNGHFAEGTAVGTLPTTAGITLGPLICWESAFGDIAFDEMQHGAQVFAIATDDAWFGTTSGPYQHAQIAQLRAIEAGAYVIRAAATGISGVIAPDGTWSASAPLDVQTVVFGNVGPPVGSVFARIGPTRIWIALIALYLIVTFVPVRRRA